jgi:DNA-binding MurR/RpiR family transcriptional regulator
MVLALTRTTGWAKDVRSVLVVLERSRGQLRQAEQLVADFALAQPGVVVQSSITDLAKAVGTSEATVLRCCRTLGYGGFPEFKLALARDLARSEEDTEDDQVDVSDPVERVGYYAHRNALMSLDKTMQLQQASRLEVALTALGAANVIVIVAVASRAALAVEAHRRLVQLGLPVVHVPANAVPDPLAFVNPGDVVLAFADATSDRWLLDVLDYAQSRSLTTILSSPQVGSALEDQADITLNSAGRSFVAGELQLESLVAELSLLETLVAALALRRYDASLAALAVREDLQSRFPTTR